MDKLKLTNLKIKTRANYCNSPQILSNYTQSHYFSLQSPFIFKDIVLTLPSNLLLTQLKTMTDPKTLFSEKKIKSIFIEKNIL